MNVRIARIAALAGVVAVFGTNAACTTESYCFDDCPGDGTGGGSSAGDSGTGGAGGGFNPSGGGSGGDIFNPGAGGSGEECLTDEICNGRDDDCDGEIDEGIDFTNLRQCGNCATNCIAAFPVGVEPESITCTPPPADRLGIDPGVCSFAECAQDYWDLDGDPSTGCEYLCEENPDRVEKPDLGGANGCGRDDDCDGLIDEDVDLCSDVENCGRCGKKCSIPNGTGRCETQATDGVCNENNTFCRVSQCDENYWDADGNGANGCEYSCEPTGPEICDGLDNDCDGLIDNADPDILDAEAEIGEECFGGGSGVCALPENAGFYKCIAGDVVCCDKGSNDEMATNPNLPDTGLRNGICAATSGAVVVRPGDRLELCNNADDDCDGSVDEQPTDAGGTCGSSVGSCNPGTMQCQSGQLVCVGETQPVPDTCDGADNDCDGVIDGSVPTTGLPVSCNGDADCTGGMVCRVRSGPSDKVCVNPPAGTGIPCNTPPPAPCVNAAGAVVDCSTAGATPVPQPCSGGVLTCVGATTVCLGAQGPLSTVDACGEDSNCDGALDNQPDLLTSVANCGACGNDCRLGGAHVNWSCVAGECVPNATDKCQPGYIDCDGNPNDCETACIPSGAELCNGFDDDCDCEVDEDPAVPSPVQVCGVAQTASDPGCTTGVTVSCTNGGWTCSFPNGYCTGGNCAATTDRCDGIDNNCNGIADENFVAPFRATRAKNTPCFSDDGLPPPGHGACRGEGTYVCNAQGTDTVCPVQKDESKATQEICNGVDDDCDSVVDEHFGNPAAADGNYVKPAVVSLGGGRWIYRYEASRPNATLTAPGSGNGYHTSAPAGATLDATLACSVPDKIPWFNVTPTEAEQTCAAVGGHVCTTNEWQTACRAAASCDWGYGTGCSSPADYDDGPYCNLHAFDFDPSTPTVIDDGLLPTASNQLDACFANVGAGVFDVTGNLREITKTGSNYILMGGAFNTHVEEGATCDFDFFSVKSSFRLFDTGFRCCFDQNPSPP